MSLGNDILTILFDYSAGYQRMRKILLSPDFNNNINSSKLKNQTLYITLARLKKQHLVTKNEKTWAITEMGRQYFKKKLTNLLPSHQDGATTLSHERNMIIAFDIPETYRRKRDWLRIELKLLNFLPIQKSVWLGPVPLPKVFIENLNKIHILKYLKIFEVKEKDII